MSRDEQPGFGETRRKSSRVRTINEAIEKSKQEQAQKAAEERLRKSVVHQAPDAQSNELNNWFIPFLENDQESSAEKERKRAAIAAAYNTIQQMNVYHQQMVSLQEAMKVCYEMVTEQKRAPEDGRRAADPVDGNVASGDGMEYFPFINAGIYHMILMEQHIKEVTEEKARNQATPTVLYRSEPDEMDLQRQEQMIENAQVAALYQESEAEIQRQNRAQRDVMRPANERERAKKAPRIQIPPAPTSTNIFRSIGSKVYDAFGWLLSGFANFGTSEQDATVQEYYLEYPRDSDRPRSILKRRRSESSAENELNAKRVRFNLDLNETSD